MRAVSRGSHVRAPLTCASVCAVEINKKRRAKEAAAAAAPPAIASAPPPRVAPTIAPAAAPFAPPAMGGRPPYGMPPAPYGLPAHMEGPPMPHKILFVQARTAARPAPHVCGAPRLTRSQPLPALLRRACRRRLRRPC